MKSKVCLFLIMFSIWFLFNGSTFWILEKLGDLHSNSFEIYVYFMTAFLFSGFAAIWPGDLKTAFVFVLVAELCGLIILWILGNENSVGYAHLAFFNSGFFVLVGYLTKVGAYWAGYCAGELGLLNGLALLVFEMIMIGLSSILVLAIHKLSIWLTEIWTGEEVYMQEI